MSTPVSQIKKFVIKHKTMWSLSTLGIAIYVMLTFLYMFTHHGSSLWQVYDTDSIDITLRQLVIEVLDMLWGRPFTSNTVTWREKQVGRLGTSI